MAEINKTQLFIDRALERGIVHRDYLAHCLRWSHIIKWVAKLKSPICVLDIGCGDFPFLKVLYTNKFHPKYYLGVDVRDLSSKIPKVNFESEFMLCNLTKQIPTCKYDNWDIIVCLEVLEHNDYESGCLLLENIKQSMNKNTLLFLSTPCFDGVNKANNHIYEWRYDELKIKLESLFNIDSNYGTFISKRDLKPHLSFQQQNIYSSLENYYDSNVISILMAPLFPQYSRNCIWRLRLK